MSNITCCKCDAVTFRPNEVDGWPEGWIGIGGVSDGQWMCPDCRVPEDERTYVKAKAMTQYR